EHLVGFAQHGDIAIELGESGAGGGGAVRADGDKDGVGEGGAQLAHPKCGHAQLGLRAAPEEVGGRGGEDDELGIETAQPGNGGCGSEVFEMGVENDGVVAGELKLLLTEEQLEGEMGFVAAEVGRAGEIPSRLDEGVAHGGAQRVAASSRSKTKPRSRSMPLGSAIQVSGSGWLTMRRPEVRIMASMAARLGINQ